MQIPIGIIIISIFQLLFFIVSVYFMIFLHLGNRNAITIPEVLFAMAQAAILVLLIKYYNSQTTLFPAWSGGENLVYIVNGTLLFLLIICYSRLLRKALASRRDSLTSHSIRETIDYLPGGICFATPNGRPVLTNRRMNELIFTLTNRTILNVHTVWEDLRRPDFANGCRKAELLPMPPGPVDNNAADSMFFILPDSSIWRFSKVVLTDSTPHYIQLDAAEVTELYYLSKELFDNNARLTEQYARQRSLLENIVEINHEKEILSTKMRIHDDLGRSILTTRQHLANGTVTENLPALANVWINAINKMEEYAHINEDSEVSPEIELLRAAEMIGCHIDFHGDRPENRKTALLFYAAVREALTNAVMHAKADRLFVRIWPEMYGYHVEISDNGTKQSSSITEGNGLGTLRRRLEREGADLQIKSEGGVSLIIELPYSSIQEETA